MNDELLENEELVEDSKKDMYMTFKSEKECFAIGIQYVNEIIGYQTITKIPRTQEYIKGLINLRGKVIPVIDVRLRFKKPPIEYNDRTCIIVIDVNSTVIGLIVDRIVGVVTITKDDILPPPSIGKKNSSANKYVYGIGKVNDGVRLLLDPYKLIYDSDSEAIEEIKEEG